MAIFFTRRLQIEGEALDAVKNYVTSGKPIIGLRTASHGFQKWLEMDQEVFGGDYQGHYGANMVCEVKPADKPKDHPILKGVSPFKSNGSLYKNPKVAPDVTVLLIEHDMDIVFSFADRITVLVNGALFVDGAPAEVARDPRVKAVYLGESLDA